MTKSEEELLQQLEPASETTLVRYSRKEAVRVMLEGLTNGLSLRTICRDERMPSASTVCGWLVDDERLAEQYARAREADGQLTGEQIAEIAHKVLRGEIDPNVARVAIDALKWTAARKAPKVYGDSTRIDLRNDVTKLVAFADMSTQVRLRASAQQEAEPQSLPHVVAPDGAEGRIE